jgi:hypothetical protein
LPASAANETNSWGHGTMKSFCRNTAALLALSGGLAACSGSDQPPPSIDTPIDTDYSALRQAESREGGLQYAKTDELFLRPLRNGLRLSLVGIPGVYPAGPDSASGASAAGAFSGTTAQVDGVDEADLVKYDGRYIYSLQPAPFVSGQTHPVLTIARTQPATAQIEVVSKFELNRDRDEALQGWASQLYQVQSEQGVTQYLAVIEQFPQVFPTESQSLVVQPNRTRVQLLAVRDPANVAQAWQIELDGFLRASRKIGDTLYLVTSFRPAVSGLTLPADTRELKEANERRIRDASASELLPRFRENGGAERQLVAATDCVLPADLAANEAYFDLVVVTAIDLNKRVVAGSNCLSTNVSGVYVSRDSLYVGGEGLSLPGISFTVLHKFALLDGSVLYGASGAVGGHIGWLNASYFMDEHDGDLRIVTTRSDARGDIHRLFVLRQTGTRLSVFATLPNAVRTAPIGKPGEQVHAVRFFGDRAYVVTARKTDPLHVFDLSNAADPFIAGTLEIPGVATYLQPVGPAAAQLLLSVGRQTGNVPTNGDGVKVELFDVSDIAQPRSLGAEVFGKAGSSSEATGDPHALTLLPLADPSRYRIALPIDVFDTPNPARPERPLWSYSGSHLLEIQGIGSATPQLTFKGVMKTAEPGNGGPLPPFVVPNRAVLHDDSVFVISGERLIGTLWDTVLLPAAAHTN